jgi:hypothetical protein
MSLSEVVSNAGGSGFAQVGFVISFVVFSLIVIWALLRPKAAIEAEARSVLDDGQTDVNLSLQKEPVDGRQ